MLKLKILLLFSVAFGLTFAPTALADRYVVEPGTPGANPESPYDSWATAATNIQVAVGAASAGETIWVSNGTYKATGAGTLFAGVTTMVHLATNVILRSVNGPEVTILDGGYPDITNRVISLNRNAALYGFTVVNGRAGGGGGILIGDYGGIVSNCVVFSNISDKALNSGKYTGGGGIFSYATTGTGYFYNCSVYNNTTISNNGGGAYFSENLIASQCVFSNNATDGYGGGVYLLQGATALDDCIIINNSSTNSGAGLFAASGGAGAIISKCVISGNTGDRGAGCFLNSPVEYCKIIK